MNNIWSKYIQTTAELYDSRDLRFTDDNKQLWLNAIGAKSSDKVLEIGCAGGTFCHKLKKYIPGIDITGIDLDEGHIEFAKAKSTELSLDCKFLAGDAAHLPFNDNSFDVCFSHTVSEHIPHDAFFGEQYRVLKPGGKICVLSVRTRFNIKSDGVYAPTDEECRLMKKAWSSSDDFDKDLNIGAYELDEHDYPRELEKYSFHHVNVNVFTIIDYAPDNSSVNEETALRQISCKRMSCIESLQKALNRSPNALTSAEQERLVELINHRFDSRIEQYRFGSHLWDFTTSTVLAVTGIK
ncbi:MAG: class I SAM-dependent methyltransferase [Clostridiales bacterium]|nr:class I SAM-dependent methyltransferase [Clostridiales bacterium]